MQNREKYAVASREEFLIINTSESLTALWNKFPTSYPNRVCRRVVGKTLNLKYTQPSHAFSHRTAPGAEIRVAILPKQSFTFPQAYNKFRYRYIMLFLNSPGKSTGQRNLKIWFLDWVNLYATVYLSAIHWICLLFQRLICQKFVLGSRTKVPQPGSSYIFLRKGNSISFAWFAPRLMNGVFQYTSFFAFWVLQPQWAFSQIRKRDVSCRNW